MRTIFISPLLWKRLHRAVRRREEGQALVLVALSAVALVAIVGLSVDGGMTFYEAQKLQRAADAAALAGVVWIPNLPDVANARGRLTVQAAGYNNFYTDNNQQLGYSVDQVNSGAPGDYTSYWGETPTPYQYKVTLATKVPHYFLGVLGITDSYLQREAKAEYAQPARLGGSFNYFGSSGLRYDWAIRNEAFQGTSPARQQYYNTLWQRYIGARCDQNPRPDPCVGTFWLGMLGPENNHANADAYSPIGDGAKNVRNGGPYSGIGGVKIDNDSQSGPAINPGTCYRISNVQTWFYTVNDTPGSPNSCNKSASSPNVVNKDRHPDSDGQQGFGYSMAIQIDSAALVPNFTDPTQPYTSFKVSVFDAAMSDVGSGFASGDSPWNTSTSFGIRPDNSLYVDPSKVTNEDRNSPVSERENGVPTKVNCAYPNTFEFPDPANYGQSRVNSSGVKITGGDITPDTRICFNQSRMRFSLYYPPAAVGVPTSWRTKGALVAAWDTPEMSVQQGEWGGSGSTDNNQCYLADTGYTQMPNGTKVKFNPTNTTSLNAIFVYACPAKKVSEDQIADFYWNAAGNTDDPSSHDVRAVGLTVNSSSRVDPSQGCRSLVDSALYDNSTDYANALNLTTLVNPPYRNDRVPFNMRGADPNYTGPTAAYNNIQNGPTGLYNLTGGYQSYHGWRCSWDFDSNNTLNPGPTGYDNPDPKAENSLRKAAEGINNQPYLYISNFGYVPGDPSCATVKCRISYNDGVRAKANSGDQYNVRAGVYLLQVQDFGGSGYNTYTLKAEYENPQLVNYCFPDATSYSGTVCVDMYPVPQVYGITAMSVYMNARNNTNSPLNVIFDLAYIPRQNAGALATLELFDPGDVGAQLNIELLKPSGYGQKLLANGKVPYSTDQRLDFRVAVCPSQYSGNSSIPCVFPSGTNSYITANPGGGAGNSYFNDQWLFLLFRIPDAAEYDSIGATCQLQQVPEQLCYYYQVNYQLASSGSANDGTVWQLNIRNQPVHLVT